LKVLRFVASRAKRAEKGIVTREGEAGSSYEVLREMWIIHAENRRRLIVPAMRK